SPTTPTTTVQTAPNTPQQLAADKALARRAVLRLTDLPLGYHVAKDQSASSSGDNVPPAVSRRFASCAHLPPAVAKAMLSSDPPPGVVDAESKSFEADPEVLSQLTISGSVDIGRTSSQVAEFLTILDS